MPHLHVPLLLVTALLGASDAAVPSEGRHQTFLSAFNAVPQKQRGQWVSEHVLSRIRRASEFALSAENLALQRRFVGIVEFRLRAGSQISDAGLRTLLRKMESLERLAIDRLLVRYGQKLSEIFPQPRDRELRAGAWEKVQDAWTAAGEPAANRNQMIAWLDVAIGRLSVDATAKLPALPAFDTVGFAGIEHPDRVRIATSKMANPKPPARRITAKPPMELVPLPVFDSADAEVNVAELNTQIARYNLAAASITARLAATEHPPVDVVAEIVDELEELSQRHGTLNLYVGLLEPTEAQLIVAPKSLDPVVAVVARRIFSLRQQLDGATLSQAEAARLRDRLAHLSKRLAQLVATAEDGSG